MSYEEIILIDHINLEDEQCDVYIHTKDKRVLGLTDVCSNAIISYNVLYVDHYVSDMRFTFALPMSEFSHVEYITKSRAPEKFDYKKEFDDINSFIDEQIDEFNAPEVLREP